MMKAITVVVGMLVALLAANATAGSSKLQGNMYVPSNCGGCLATSVDSAKFIITKSNAPDSNGIRVKVKVKDPIISGQTTSLNNVRIALALDRDDGNGCLDYISTDTFAGNPLLVALTGEDFNPEIPEQDQNHPVLRPCGYGVAVISGNGPVVPGNPGVVVWAGLQLGFDQDL